jgi:hypothetical protein
MRINIYSQELSQETALVRKTTHDTGVTYYGVRLYLQPPHEPHNAVNNDKRSAITFWIPAGHSMSKVDLANTLREMADKVASAPTTTRS